MGFVLCFDSVVDVQLYFIDRFLCSLIARGGGNRHLFHIAISTFFFEMCVVRSVTYLPFVLAMLFLTWYVKDLYKSCSL